MKSVDGGVHLLSSNGAGSSKAAIPNSPSRHVAKHDDEYGQTRGSEMKRRNRSNALTLPTMPRPGKYARALAWIQRGRE